VLSTVTWISAVSASGRPASPTVAVLAGPDAPDTFAFPDLGCRSLLRKIPQISLITHSSRS
jgi:hypothetical protein